MVFGKVSVAIWTIYFDFGMMLLVHIWYGSSILLCIRLIFTLFLCTVFVKACKGICQILNTAFIGYFYLFCSTNDCLLLWWCNAHFPAQVEGGDKVPTSKFWPNTSSVLFIGLVKTYFVFWTFWLGAKKTLRGSNLDLDPPRPLLVTKVAQNGC